MKTATLAQSIKLLTLIEQDGTPREQIQNLLASGLFSELLHADFICGVDRIAFREIIGIKNPNCFTVVVDYDLPIRVGANELFGGSWDGAIIDEDFVSPKRSGKSKETIVLVDSKENSRRPSDALADLDAKGLRPADLPELLALTRAYGPSLVCNVVVEEIYALGSHWQNDEDETISFPTLGGGPNFKDGMHLMVTHFNSGDKTSGGARTLLAAVRKK